jgi:DNA repair protein RadA/Sms
MQLKWTGSCGGCQSWNTLSEELQAKEVKRTANCPFRDNNPILLSEVEQCSQARLQSGLGDLDRLFGGGISVGSLTLIGGEPGVGKSTLLLQLASSLAVQGNRVLYVSGEESCEQTSLRARRLGIAPSNLFVVSETMLGAILHHVGRLKPQCLIIDSVQIIYKEELSSAPGSVVQVREVTHALMSLAKQDRITTFLIGHVTKSGELAGPRVLEHLVDTVLEFEGEVEKGYRLLRVRKNRFGPTEEIALFQMKEEGLLALENPSLFFLAERKKELFGSSIVPSLEGVRSFLLEIQALVTPTSFPTPTRRSTGIDANRLALLLAVMEKRVGYPLHHFDVFVALTGGLKVQEPALDLGIVMALASSFSSRPLPFDMAFLGEVGLGGDIRGVVRVETRLKELLHMGFRKVILPKLHRDELQPGWQGRLELIGVDLVDQAISRVLQA